MKKLIALSLLLFIIGCDNSTGSESVHPLVGTWEITEITATSGSQSVTLTADDDNNQTFIFNAVGTYSYVTEMDGEYSSGNGTWSTTDNNITFIEDGETSILSYSVSGGILTLTSSDTTDGITTTLVQIFQKQ